MRFSNYTSTHRISHGIRIYRGLTLVEVMMAMTIFVVLAGGIIAGVFTVRADAENNLYETAALNVAISFLEQTKSINYDLLGEPYTTTDGDAYQTYIIGFNETINVIIGEETNIEVPIISDEDGNVKKKLDVALTINIDEASTLNGYWITIEYSWQHPTSKKTYTGEVRSFRSEVSL